MKNSESRSLDVEKSSKKNCDVTFEQAFNLTGNGWFNHLVLLTCGLILLYVSMETVGMSYVIPAAECDLRLTSSEKGLITAAAYIGIIATSFFWGYLSDKLGRRAVMLPAIFASAVVSFASSFATNVWILLTLRILAGCLVSASSATVYAYLGEMHTDARRASAIALGSAFISFSFIILPGLAWAIIPGKWSFTLFSMEIVPWRVFMWSWCLPGVISAIILIFLPESPRFVLASKGPSAAIPVLKVMYTWNHKHKVYPVDEITITASVQTQNSGFVGAMKNIGYLFQPPLLLCGIIANILMFAVFMLSSGLYLWTPDILNNVLDSTRNNSYSICHMIHEKFEITKNASLSPDEACSSEVSVGIFPVSMAMGGLFGLVYVAIGLFINKIGKKTFYCSIMVVCGLATAGVGWAARASSGTALLVVALCSGCASSILAAITVDVFPTSMRAMAMCVMYMIGRMGAAFGSNFLGATLDAYCQQAFTTFGAFSVGSCILMLFWPKPEKVREAMEKKGFTY